MGAEYAAASNEERWPENTLLSFCKVAQLGVPMVEFDVLPLRDSSALVIYHTFNIVTKRSGRIRSCGCPEYQIDLFDGETTIVILFSYFFSLRFTLFFFFP